MKRTFHGYKLFWFTNYGGADVSLGLHWCWAGRLDLHVGPWMLSFGRVPVYGFDGKLVAVSNSFHSAKEAIKQKMAIRAGVPFHPY